MDMTSINSVSLNRYLADALLLLPHGRVTVPRGIRLVTKVAVRADLPQAGGG